MSRVTIWQCQDGCCDYRPFPKRWWAARSKDFAFYEWAPTYREVADLTRDYFNGVTA